MNDLSAYHNFTVAKAGAVDDYDNYSHDAAEEYDECSELAVEIVAAALAKSGADDGPDHLDALGTIVSDDVQTLLQLALFRCPELRYYLESLHEAEINRGQWTDEIEVIKPVSDCTIVHFSNGYSICSHRVKNSDFDFIPSLRHRDDW